MRRILLLVMAVTLVGALTLAGTVDAKKKHKAATIKTGPYPGSATSNPPGLPSSTAQLTAQISKSHGKVDLSVSYQISVSCSGHANDTEESFGGLVVNKKNGKFSGKTLKAFPGGTVTGKVKGKSITATWKYKHSNCTSSGTLTAKHA